MPMFPDSSLRTMLGQVSRFARIALSRSSAFGIRALPVGLVLASTLTGCFVETHDDAAPAYVVPARGTLVVDWTIDGYADPAKCSQSSSAAIEITVYDAGGASVGTFQQDCTAFATSIALDAGRYTASALLVDGANGARTTTLEMDAFQVYGDDQLTVPIDFPADSFY